MRLIVISAAVSSLALAACTTTDPYSSAPGRKNALIGAGVGALAGAAVGNYMDRQQRALEQELSGTGVGVIRDGDNLILRMPSDVTFASNQASVQSQFYPVLDDVAQVLRTYDQSLVDIMGHADSDGTDAYNLDLSRRRAISVADLLVTRGVQPQRLVVDGYGEARPIASNATPQGKAQNRRVEITIRPFRG